MISVKLDLFNGPVGAQMWRVDSQSWMRHKWPDDFRIRNVLIDQLLWDIYPWIRRGNEIR